MMFCKSDFRLNSQYFIFFVTSEWAQKARVLHYTRPESLASGKQSSILGQIICLKEHEEYDEYDFRCNHNTFSL
jgi:hypothetical protein